MLIIVAVVALVLVAGAVARPARANTPSMPVAHRLFLLDVVHSR